MKVFLYKIKEVYLENNIEKVIYFINKNNNESKGNFERLLSEKEIRKNNICYTLNLEHPLVRRILK